MIPSTYNSETGELHVTIPGDVLSTNAEERASDITGLIQKHQGFQMLELDLTSAKMVDSMGLNMLLAMVNRTRQTGAKVKIVISNPLIQRVFQFARLGEIATIELRDKRRRS